MDHKRFLFLQSHPSLFGRTLVQQMRSDGVECHLINVSLGDFVFRIGTGAKNYFGKLRNWRSYLDDFITTHNITDIVYYADQRPYHRIARSLAYRRGIRTYAYEFGYLRPDWITLERGGMGAFSHFPNNPDLIKELAEKVNFAEPSDHYPYPFAAEAFCEVVYHAGPIFLPIIFPHYRRDRYYHPLIDFPSYIPRLLRSKKSYASARALIDKLIADRESYFVVPMQMQSDYQIRRASHYTHMSEMVDQVIRSFKRSAPSSTKLVFKIHPLDNNIEKWPRVIEEIAAGYDLSKRIVVIDGGDVHTLIRHAKGVAVINSTTGIAALQFGVPLKVLGIAIFDVPGMTHQGTLDTFWVKPMTPDRTITKAFLKLLKASVQVKGNFFTRAGREAAAKEFSRRLRNEEVNNYGAFVETPPRLAQARRMNVPMTYEDLIY